MIKQFLNIGIIGNYRWGQLIDMTFDACESTNCRYSDEHTWKFDGQVFWEPKK